MVALNLIAETFVDLEHAAHQAALRDLAAALARQAPRSCTVRVLTTAAVDPQDFVDPRLSSSTIPLPQSTLPYVWRSNYAAKPLDGEFVHAHTPLLPLRPRTERPEGTQNTVYVPHLAFLERHSPLTGAVAKQYRRFLKRAVKYADVLLAPNYDVANRLYSEFGAENVRVLACAAPSEFLQTKDSYRRRKELWLPAEYMVTTLPCASDRLAWVIAAVQENHELPPLVVVEPLSRTGVRLPGASAEAAPQQDAVTGADSGTDAPTPVNSAVDSAVAAADAPQANGTTPRVIYVQPEQLSDYGAILSGASLLVLPQHEIASGYEVYGAIAAGVPIVHAELPAASEIAYDGGVIFNSQQTLAATLATLFDANGKSAELARLEVLAKDRSRVYTWDATAQSLWQIHAEL